MSPWRISRLEVLLPAALLAVAFHLGAPRSVGAQLTDLGNVLLDQCDGTPDPCETGDQLGSAVAAGDFDGDGFIDLAVGVPGEDVSGYASAGAVHVFYGSPGGLRTTGDQFFTQSTSGVAGGPETNDRWGWALTAGRFNLDAYDDLAIGGPFEDLTVGSVNVLDAGAVWVLFGSASGLTGAGSRYFDQETSPISGDSIEAGDRFGEILATAPSFRSDVHDALLIGTPREDGLWADEGAVFWLGQYSGGTLNVAYRYLQSDYYSACGELGETNDFFGAALAGDSRWSDAAGDFPSFDWVVGAPGESLTSPSNGRLGVDYHSSATRQCWDQNSSGVLGTAGVDDFFASALAAGDFDDDGDSDLAIGAPGETLAGGYEGVVQVLYNNGSVLTSNLDQMFDQDDFAPNSSAETGDWFGDPLAVGDFDGDGAADLAIGVPLEGVVVSGSSRSAAGEVDVLYGGAGVGLSTNGKQTFHQSQPVGMLGTPITNDQFGFAIATGDFDGNGSADLAIGVPNDTQGGISQVGTVQVVYGLDGDLGAFGTVQFASSTASYDESDAATPVILLRSGSAVVAATVDHARSGGTATPGTDFSYTPGSETWGVGDDGFETFSFSITQDTLDEPNETIVFALSNPTEGTALGSPMTFTVTMVDDDVAGTLQFGGPTYSIPEAGGAATITVTRAGGAASAVTVHYETWTAGGGTATAGQDYAAVAGTLTFGAAEASRTFEIPIANDPTDEPNETVVLRLSSPGGGGTLGAPSLATLTITDDDPTGQNFRDGFESGGTTAWSGTIP